MTLLEESLKLVDYWTDGTTVFKIFDVTGKRLATVAARRIDDGLSTPAVTTSIGKYAHQPCLFAIRAKWDGGQLLRGT